MPQLVDMNGRPISPEQFALHNGQGQPGGHVVGGQVPQGVIPLYHQQQPGYPMQVGQHGPQGDPNRPPFRQSSQIQGGQVQGGPGPNGGFQPQYQRF